MNFVLTFYTSNWPKVSIVTSALDAMTWHVVVLPFQNGAPHTSFSRWVVALKCIFHAHSSCVKINYQREMASMLWNNSHVFYSEVLLTYTRMNSFISLSCAQKKFVTLFQRNERNKLTRISISHIWKFEIYIKKRYI